MSYTIQGNHSVIKSPDEYTIVVETARGPKDFQYDQVFTPDHGQEKVFEDTNVSATISMQITFNSLLTETSVRWTPL